MARNDFRSFSFQSVERAHLCAGADVRPDARAASWRALANVAVASTQVAAVVVSGLALCEAVLAPSTVKLARHAPNPSGSQSSHARAQAHEPFLPTATQVEPVLFVTD